MGGTQSKAATTMATGEGDVEGVTAEIMAGTDTSVITLATMGEAGDSQEAAVC